MLTIVAWTESSIEAHEVLTRSDACRSDRTPDLHPLFSYPQLPSDRPIAPNRDPVQLARMGRAVLNQKHNRSYQPAHQVAEGAFAS